MVGIPKLAAGWPRFLLVWQLVFELEIIEITPIVSKYRIRNSNVLRPLKNRNSFFRSWPTFSTECSTTEQLQQRSYVMTSMHSVVF